MKKVIYQSHEYPTIAATDVDPRKHVIGFIAKFGSKGYVHCIDTESLYFKFYTTDAITNGNALGKSYCHYSNIMTLAKKLELELFVFDSPQELFQFLSK